MSNSTTLCEGKIKFFNPEKGFGFITNSVTSKDIFFHKKKIASGCAITSMDKDKIVTYTEKEGRKGAEAVDVQLR